MSEKEDEEKIAALKARIAAAKEKLKLDRPPGYTDEEKNVIKALPKIAKRLSKAGDGKSEVLHMGTVQKGDFDYLKVVEEAAHGRKVVGLLAVLVTEPTEEDFNEHAVERPLNGEEVSIFRVALAIRGELDAHEIGKMLLDDVVPKLGELRDSLHLERGGCEGCAGGHGGATKPMSRDREKKGVPMGAWPGGKIPVC